MIFEYAIWFLLLGFMLLMTFKSVFLKFILLIYWYPLITIYLYCIGYPLGGSIDVLGRPANELYCISAFEYAVLGFFILVAVLWKIRLEIFEFDRFLFSELFRTFIAIVLIVASAFAYPKAFGIGDQRWNLIPGPWLVISISLNAILLISLRTFKSLASVIQVLISLVLIVGGERANTLVVFLLFFMLYGNKEEETVIEKKLNLPLIIFGSIGVILAIGAHYWRAGQELNQTVFLANLVSSSTVGDVAHIYLTSFGYLAENGIDLRPIVNEVGSMLALPKFGGTGKHIEYNFTEILRNFLFNNGGGLFYSEGVLIFGKIGVLIYSVVYGFLIRLLYKYSKYYWWVAFTMLVFLMLQLRIQWYGFMYIYMPVFFGIIAIKMLELIKVRGDEFQIIEEEHLGISETND